MDPGEKLSLLLDPKWTLYGALQFIWAELIFKKKKNGVGNKKREGLMSPAIMEIKGPPLSLVAACAKETCGPQPPIQWTHKVPSIKAY